MLKTMGSKNSCNPHEKDNHYAGSSSTALDDTNKKIKMWCVSCGNYKVMGGWVKIVAPFKREFCPHCNMDGYFAKTIEMAITVVNNNITALEVALDNLSQQLDDEAAKDFFGPNKIHPQGNQE